MRRTTISPTHIGTNTSKQASESVVLILHNTMYATYLMWRSSGLLHHNVWAQRPDALWKKFSSVSFSFIPSLTDCRPAGKSSALPTWLGPSLPWQSNTMHVTRHWSTCQSWVSSEQSAVFQQSIMVFHASTLLSDSFVEPGSTCGEVLCWPME